jgi:hypothetical protein
LHLAMRGEESSGASFVFAGLDLKAERHLADCKWRDGRSVFTTEAQR